MIRQPVLLSEEDSLPPGWHIVETRGDGRAYQKGSIRVNVSVAIEEDGRRWMHVSVSHPKRLPYWGELRLVKNTFIGSERKAIQVFPPQAEYVNIHPRVQHLWSCLDGDLLPDFTGGSGSI